MYFFGVVEVVVEVDRHAHSIVCIFQQRCFTGIPLPHFLVILWSLRDCCDSRRVAELCPRAVQQLSRSASVCKESQVEYLEEGSVDSASSVALGGCRRSSR